MDNLIGIKRDDFHTLCQETWETLGNATLFDERFINKLFDNLNDKNYEIDLKGGILK